MGLCAPACVGSGGSIDLKDRRAEACTSKLWTLY